MSKQIVRLNSTLHWLSTLGLVIYPLIAHVAVVLEQPAWAIGYLLVVVGVSIVVLLSRFGLLIRISGFVFYFILLFVGQHSGLADKLMYVLPVVIPAWLAILFIGSLWSTRGAMISRIAVRMEGKPLDLRRVRYTRYLTAVWGGVFVLMVGEAIALAVLVSFATWSWWVHVGNYLVVAILFTGELIVRRIILGGEMQLTGLLRTLVKQPWYGRNENG